ncbi:hypothetical protein KUCAC02_006970, partial [Chaenocephalus aceratus]
QVLSAPSARGGGNFEPRRAPSVGFFVKLESRDLANCHVISAPPWRRLQRHSPPPYVGKQMPQHSIQNSRQSEDSQQASMMPQSMSQGQLQSSPMS